jgi:hypothetical protein
MEEDKLLASGNSQMDHYRHVTEMMTQSVTNSRLEIENTQYYLILGSSRHSINTRLWMMGEDGGTRQCLCHPLAELLPTFLSHNLLAK